MISYFLSSFLLLTAPSAVWAQTSAQDELQRLTDVFATFITVVQALTAVAVGFAFLFFFWGLATFIRNDDASKKLEEAKSKMLWGIVAVFVLVSIWGIVYFLGILFLGSNPGGGRTGIEIFELPLGDRTDRTRTGPNEQQGGNLNQQGGRLNQQGGRLNQQGGRLNQQGGRLNQQGGNLNQQEGNQDPTGGLFPFPR